MITYVVLLELRKEIAEYQRKQMIETVSYILDQKRHNLAEALK